MSDSQPARASSCLVRVGNPIGVGPRRSGGKIREKINKRERTDEPTSGEVKVDGELFFFVFPSGLGERVLAVIGLRGGRGYYFFYAAFSQPLSLR